MEDVEIVGGKNASLGEMIQNLAQAGVRVPDGFAVTAQGYWEFLDQNRIREDLGKVLENLDLKNFSNLDEVGKKARGLLLQANIPQSVQNSITHAYRDLCDRTEENVSVAVRSSATA